MEQLKEALRLKKEGKQLKEIMNMLNITDRNYKGFQKQLWRYEHGETAQPTENSKDALLKMLNKECTLQELSDKLKLSTRVILAMLDDLKDEGYCIMNNDDKITILTQPISQENRHEEAWNGNKIIRFGLCGDNQSSSKWTQWTHLHNFYDILEAKGIETVYHTGDIDEGEEMRVGHKYECYKQGADDHVDEIVQNYPCRNNMVTKFITGNHDHSMIKRCGLDIGNQIASRRKDMLYLGQSGAIVNITPNCTLELRHPIDGTSYAISYKIQKMVDAMSGGEKPNILAVGHYHKMEQLLYRNVHCIQTGCFQAQTNWERGKGIAVVVGGWICEVEVNEEGEIKSFGAKFIPYYKSIKDDYLNWV